MELKKQQFETEVAGRTLTLEVSRLAEQANAAVLGRYGDTAVLATVVMGRKDTTADYFPLIIDYEEKFYAAGKIIGSRFIRREGRPSEEAILSARLIDRSLRPLFDHRMRRDIQIVLTVLSYDEENDPDFVALMSASMAIAISDIPWNGPVAGVRLLKNEQGEVVVNPTNSQLKEVVGADAPVFDSFVAGTGARINMIELMAKETKEDEVANGFETAHQEIKKLIAFQKEVADKIGKPKAKIEFKDYSDVFVKKISDFLKDKLEKAIYTAEKMERMSNINVVKRELMDYLKSEEITEHELVDADFLFEEELSKLVHKNILENERRVDDRKLDEVRDLHAEVAFLKRLHGSAVFMRGNTQALAVVTLAAPGAEQLIETMEISGKRRFMLHYNFPPYSTGEVGRMGSPKRREIGHGALAEKALKLLIPSQDEFPYTIRVVSEILSSNGSSSMATVCASSMALMDAGVPMKKPVAGIAMGMMSEKGQKTEGKSQKYKILTDIQGPEDHHGDMDCKIAGTSDGITAIQMDVKNDGATVDMLREVFKEAKKARTSILKIMAKAIEAPREKVSDFAPVIEVLEIKPDQIGEVIGPGGKIINGIIAQTGVLTIDIEQNGKVFVAGTTGEQVKDAVSQIHAITRRYEVGEVIEGPVIKILEFGAIVDLGGGRDGMIHVSELKNGFVKKVDDVVKVGDFVRAKVIKIENGKIGLSLKALAK